MPMDAAHRIEELKAQLDRAKEQRDSIRRTRDVCQTKLRANEVWLSLLRREYLELWKQHVYPNYDTACPDKALITHIAHREGVPASSGLELLSDGYLEVQQIRTLIESHVPHHPARILDFGCGFGRMTRYMRLLGNERTKVTACDIDLPAIEWARRHLTQSGEFLVSSDQPPLPLTMEQKFDLIVVTSVFTHLPEEMQDAWLEELVSRLTPEGLMIATFHGRYFERFIPHHARGTFASHGFVHADLGRTPDLPDYYLTAFHLERYIREHWSRFARIVEIVDEAVGLQSAALMRRLE
jgi:SAM-dependent methyltransferase